MIAAGLARERSRQDRLRTAGRPPWACARARLVGPDLLAGHRRDGALARRRRPRLDALHQWNWNRRRVVARDSRWSRKSLRETSRGRIGGLVAGDVQLLGTLRSPSSSFKPRLGWRVAFGAMALPALGRAGASTPRPEVSDVARAARGAAPRRDRSCARGQLPPRRRSPCSSAAGLLSTTQRPR